MAVVEQVRSDAGSAPVRATLKSLLAIAAAVQQGGLHVTAELVARARAAGATDLEINDTVLIAAVFYMFNRYAASRTGPVSGGALGGCGGVSGRGVGVGFGASVSR